MTKPMLTPAAVAAVFKGRTHPGPSLARFAAENVAVAHGMTWDEAERAIWAMMDMGELKTEGGRLIDCTPNVPELDPAEIASASELVPGSSPVVIVYRAAVIMSNRHNVTIAYATAQIAPMLADGRLVIDWQQPDSIGAALNLKGWLKVPA